MLSLEIKSLYKQRKQPQSITGNEEIAFIFLDIYNQTTNFYPKVENVIRKFPGMIIVLLCPN